MGKLADKVKRGVYVVAEIGGNHGGSLDCAKRMIEIAARCGVDAVKLQKRELDNMKPHVRTRPRTDAHAFGPTEYEHRQALEFDWSQHASLADIAHGLGMDYGVSTWDTQSTASLPEFADWIKIPSARATDLDMLSVAIALDKPIIASTGMCDGEDVDIINSELPADGYILQCTSAYPCENADVNLGVLCRWQRWLGRTYGLSGHHRGIQLDAAAVALGARIIERHYTLDRTGKGTDHASSLEPHGLATLVRDVQAVYDAMGDGDKRIMPSEQDAMRKLRV